MALRLCVWTISLLLAVPAGHPSLASGGRLRKIWEVDLRKVAKAGKGSPDFPVFALRFSPSGRMLAVIADVYQSGEDTRSRLLVLDTDRPTAAAPQFEVGFGILESDTSAALNFGWSPSGEIVYALGSVIHLNGETTCDLPNQSVFISDSVALSVHPDPLQSLTHVMFYGESCEERETWDVPEIWIASDVSTDRRLLSIQRDISSAIQGERLIVDPLGRRVLQRWPGSAGGVWKFANGGNVVCQGGALLDADRAPATCRNVDTGKQIAETPNSGTPPIATAVGATRVVVSDYRRRKIPFAGEYDATFKGRFVWDFGTGQELASWRPESETYKNVFKPTRQITEPFRFAMSPDGKFVAEGGNGMIRLYKIEP